MIYYNKYLKYKYKYNLQKKLYGSGTQVDKLDSNNTDPNNTDPNNTDPNNTRP